MVPIVTAVGEFAAPYLIREAGKVGIKKFIETYGSTAFQTIAGSVVGGMILDKAPPLDLQKEKLFGVPVSRITGQGEVYSDIEEPKKVEPLKYIPGIHGPKSKEQEEIEKIGQKETFPIQEWDKSYTDTGTTIPEPEKETPPVNIPPEIKTDTGTPIPEQKTWKDYILTQTKAKDITKQTKNLVTKEPEFGALTEVEKQTALLEKGDKPDFYSRAIAAITNAKQDKYTKGKWKSIVKGNTTKEEMDYLGLTELLEGKESITKQELLKLVKDKDVAATMTVRPVPKDQMNPMWVDYSLGFEKSGTQEHIVFQIGKDKGEVGQLFTSPHFNTEYGTGNFAWARVQVGYEPSLVPNAMEDAGDMEHNEWALNIKKTFDNTLIIDEIQSDWIQTGQDKGFVSDWNIVESDNLIEFLNKNNIEYEIRENFMTEGNTAIKIYKKSPTDPTYNERRDFHVVDFNPKTSPGARYLFNPKGQFKKILRKEDSAIDEILELGSVPDLPLKDSKKYVELVLNEMIRKAVKDGRDSVAITNGQIQYNRYEAMGEKERQGLKKFYDTFVYDQLNKIAKNYNVKLERIDITSNVATKEEEDDYLDQSLQRALDAKYTLQKITFQELWDRIKDTNIPGHAALYSNEGRGQGANYIEEYLTNFHSDWNKIRNNEVYVWKETIPSEHLASPSVDKISWELPIVIRSHAVNHAPELQDNDLELYKKYLKDLRPSPDKELKEEQLIKMKLPKKLQKEILKKPIRLTKKIDEQTQRLVA